MYETINEFTDQSNKTSSIVLIPLRISLFVIFAMILVFDIIFFLGK